MRIKTKRSSAKLIYANSKFGGAN